MHLAQSEYDASSPIGIFDSGVGGLSILRHIHALLPHEALLYFADSARLRFAAPAGESGSAKAEQFTEKLLHRPQDCQRDE